MRWLHEAASDRTLLPAALLPLYCTLLVLVTVIPIPLSSVVHVPVSPLTRTARPGNRSRLVHTSTAAVTPIGGMRGFERQQMRGRIMSDLEREYRSVHLAGDRKQAAAFERTCLCARASHLHELAATAQFLLFGTFALFVQAINGRAR
jgi:hypothetical protein